MENYKELVEDHKIKLKDKSLSSRERMNVIIKLQRYSMFIDYINSMRYTRLGRKYAVKINDTEAFYISSTNEAICLYELKEFKRSLRILIHNKTYFENEGKEEQLNFILFNIGNIYNDLNESEKAIRFFNESLVYYKRIKNLRNRIVINLNLSSCYLKLMQFDIAQKLCLSTLKLLDIHKVESGEFFSACLYNNLAACQIAKRDINSAIQNCQKSINILTKSDSQQYLILSFITLLDAYIVLKEDCKIDELSMTIFKLSKDNHSYHLEVLYKKLYEYNLKKNNYKNAIIYFEKFHHESVRMQNLNIKLDILNESAEVYSNIARLGHYKPANSVQNFYESNHCIFIDSTNDAIHKINISHIGYIEFNKGLTYIYTMNSGKYCTAESFRSIESKINQIKTDDHIFFSIFDRTCIINLFWLDSFDYKKKRVTIDVLGEKYTLNVSVIKARELKKLMLGKFN